MAGLTKYEGTTPNNCINLLFDSIKDASYVKNYHMLLKLLLRTCGTTLIYNLAALRESIIAFHWPILVNMLKILYIVWAIRLENRASNTD